MKRATACVPQTVAFMPTMTRALAGDIAPRSAPQVCHVAMAQATELFAVAVPPPGPRALALGKVKASDGVVG